MSGFRFRTPDFHYADMRIVKHGGRSRRVGSGAAAALCALAASVALVGCDDESGLALERPEPTPSTAGSAPSPLTAASTPERVLAQYEGFWSVVVPVADAPKERRRAMLEPYATDPALGRILRGVLAQEAYGRSTYGKYVLHPKAPEIAGAVATVQDCQDTSQAGQKDRKTGERLTKGVKNNPVVVTMKRSKDGVWRVATVEYVDGECRP